MKWLRLYSDVGSDPKVQRLPGDKFKAWINLLCVASQHDGILPRWRTWHSPFEPPRTRSPRCLMIWSRRDCSM
jgi:hypothetical protein